MNTLKLFVIASMFSLPLHAEEAEPVDACSAKIAQLESIVRTEGAGQQSGVANDIRNLLEQAKAAREKGDLKLCTSSADRAQSLYKTATGS